MANPIGRPLTIQSAEQFDNLVDSYVAMCQDSNTPLTLTGMILALGFYSKKSFYEYGHREQFVNSVTRARMIIENSYEQKLHSSPKDINGSSMQFALKNMDWSDKVDVNHGGQPQNPIVAATVTTNDPAELSKIYQQMMAG